MATHRQRRGTSMFGVGAVFVALAVVAACSTSSPAAAPAPTTSGVGTVTHLVAGQPFAVAVPGYGTVANDGSAVATPGDITVSPVEATKPPATIGGVTVDAGGNGIHVALGTVTLSAPVAVTVPAPAVGPGEMALAAHVADDGTWTIVESQVVDGNLVVATDQFSSIVAIVGRLAADAVDGIFDSLTGRSEPADCGSPAVWAEAIPPATGAVHACTRARPDGTAELEIKSNRGHAQWVQLPSDLPRNFVWVEDEPDWLRHIIGKATNTDPATTVLLGPGKRMTIGYSRPADSKTLSFLTYNTNFSILYSVGAKVASTLMADRAPLAGLMTLYCFDAVDVNVNAMGLDVSHPKLSGSTFSCLIDKAAKLYTNRLAAVREAEGWLAGQGTAADVTKLADGLQKVGKAAAIISAGSLAVQAITLLEDSVVNAFGNDNASAVTLLVTGTGSGGAPAKGGGVVDDRAAVTQVPATPPPTAAPTTSRTAPPPTPPPPGPTTWSETTGGVAHTWTNYTNAGGVEGPTIGAYQTVQIACRIEGFRVSDGNVWWYRIAQAPWNGQYYVSADAFYNIAGQTSGSLHGTPFVDEAVAHC